VFEFFLNKDLYNSLTYKNTYDEKDRDINAKKTIDAYKNAGYDYATIIGSEFEFHSSRLEKQGKLESINLNDGAIIFDRESFESYAWPDADACDYSVLDRLAGYLPDGMKFIIWGEGGVLENVTKLLGFENMCFEL